MWYMIYGVDFDDSPDNDSAYKRSQARPAHLARLQALRDAGRLLLAGPLPESEEQNAPRMVGSLILADFASINEARAWAADDPYAHAGVYRAIHIHPWKGVFMPDVKNLST